MQQAKIISNLRAEFGARFGATSDAILAIAPGRVNLIGEHTDYNDGFVLPMTLDRAVYIAWQRRADNVVNLYSMNFQESVSFDINSLTKTTKYFWANYIKGIMQVLQEEGFKLSGVEGVVYGDVPLASGLSSSAALEIAAIIGLQKLFALDLSPIATIKLAQRAENNFIGVKCGIMDQFVSRLGKQNHALFIDCRTLDYKDVPIDFGENVLLVVNSKVKRELAKSAYNERRASCELVVKHLQQNNPAIAALRDVEMPMLEKARRELDPIAYQRARHVISENSRVLDAIRALENRDQKTFGNLLYASHASLQNDYAVSCAELDFIVACARDAGALGARLTGAGFGGCAIVLLDKKLVENFSYTLTTTYQHKFNLAPEIISVENNFPAEVRRLG